MGAFFIITYVVYGVWWGFRVRLKDESFGNNNYKFIFKVVVYWKVLKQRQRRISFNSHKNNMVARKLVAR